jgi:hypothetical protein
MKLLLFLLSLILPSFAGAHMKNVPCKNLTKEACISINKNFENLQNEMDNRLMISPMLPEQAADIDDAITSIREGQQIWNSAANEMCVSTETASNSAWAKLHAPTTACSN